ncbi:MAG: carboxypeptidase regulatory-like domain-containing protein [Sandaracinaceae bacterium]|nr:carboxypeptidase regulatory-like domain-containing protein [Sandaracinaceae bacterium]
MGAQPGAVHGAAGGAGRGRGGLPRRRDPLRGRGGRRRWGAGRRRLGAGLRGGARRAHARAPHGDVRHRRGRHRRDHRAGRRGARGPPPRGGARSGARRHRRPGLAARSDRAVHGGAARAGGDRAIAGRAVDGEGAPVPDARVLARFDVPGELHPERGATTGDDGAFVLEGLDEGRYELTATAPGRARGRAVAAAGAEGVAIELAAEGRVRVRVLDVDGEPVAAATIVVERAMGDLEQETLAVVSGYDAEGAFDVGGLPLGPCRVVAVAPGFAASEPVSAIAAADPRPTEVRVGRGGTILGRVVSGSDGHPIEGARVTLEGRLGASSSAVPVSSSALTDADGRFELSGAPPGVGSVVAWAADHHGRVRSGIAIAERVRVDIGTLDLSPVEDGEEPRIELAGIGAVLSADQDVLRIGRVVDGGGAAEVGLGAGDAILRIDGAPVGGLGFGGSIERIRGPEGTSVRLEVRRAGAEQSEIIAVPRRRIRA